MDAAKLGSNGTLAAVADWEFLTMDKLLSSSVLLDLMLVDMASSCSKPVTSEIEISASDLEVFAAVLERRESLGCRVAEEVKLKCCCKFPRTSTGTSCRDLYLNSFSSKWE